MTNYAVRRKKGMSLFMVWVILLMSVAGGFGGVPQAEASTNPSLTPLIKIFNSYILDDPNYTETVALNNQLKNSGLDSDNLTLMVSFTPVKYQNQIIASKDPQNGNAGWSVELLKTGHIQFNIGSENGTCVSVVTKDILYWPKYTTNLAVKYGNGKAKILFDGKPVEVYLKSDSAVISEEASGIGGVSVLSGAELIFGGTSTKPFKGTVSNIYVYKTVLQDSDIELLLVSPIWSWAGMSYKGTTTPANITGVGNYLFDGIQPNEVAAAADFTLSADITIGQATAAQELFFRGNALYYNSFSVQASTQANLAIHGGSDAGDKAWFVLTNFFDGNKVNFTLTYSDSTSTMKVYRNGILQTTQSKSIGKPPASSILSIGKKPSGGGSLLDFTTGSIENVKVYHKALSDYQVAQLNNVNDPSITPVPRPEDPIPVPDTDNFPPMPTPGPTPPDYNAENPNYVNLPDPTEGSILLKVTDMQKEETGGDNPYQKDAELLYKLGVLNADKNGKLNLDLNITKGEMAVSLIRILGIDTEAIKDSITIKNFEDVPAGHYAGPSIMTANALGIVNGVNDTMFGINEKVTYQQALKMIVCALGYRVKAESNGGYPNGYVLAGSDLGLDKGVNLAPDASITVGVLAKLYKNSLNVNILKDTSYGGRSYEIQKGSNLLEKMGITQLTGIVTANQYTGIPKDSNQTTLYPNTKKGYVSVNGLNFKVGTSNLDKYLGAKVSIYYKEDDVSKEDNVILYAKAASDDSAKVSLNAWAVKEIEIMNAGSSQTRILDNDNDGTTETVKISRDAVCIYNDRHDGGYLFSNVQKVIANRNGAMELFDTNGDDIYDVVHIFQYEIYVVDTVAPGSNKVNFKNENRVLDLDADIDECAIYKGDKIIGVADLKPYDILNIATSKDGLIEKAYLTTQKSISSELVLPAMVNGKITEIEDCTDYGLYTITDKNGKSVKYRTTISFWIRNKDVYKLGDNETFYFDQFGSITYCAGDKAASGLYGYLMQTGSRGLANLRVKLLTATGDMVVYDVENNLNVNCQDTVTGEVYKKKFRHMEDFNLFFSKYDAESDKWVPNRQLIKYDLNKEGKISEIYTSKDEFDFLCVPVTDYTSDGLPKRFYSRPTFTDKFGMYGGYALKDFYTDSITRRHLPEEKVAVDRAGGLLPLSVLPKEDRAAGGKDLRRHYINYDVGRYTVDSPAFSFFRISGFGYKPDWSPLKYDTDTVSKAMVRSVFYTSTNADDSESKTTYEFPQSNNPGNVKKVSGETISGSGDTTDSLNNMPGYLTKISTDLENQDNDYALVDGRYLLTSKTKIFSVPAFIDGNGNIYDSSTASEGNYSVISTQYLVNKGQYALQLFDIDESNQVSAAVIIDPLSLGCVTKGLEKSFSYTGTLMKKPTVVAYKDNETAYKYEVRLTNGKSAVLYSKKDRTPISFGSLMRWFDDSRKMIGDYAVQYKRDIVTATNDPVDTLPTIKTETQYAAERVKGYYEDIKMPEMSVGTVFLYNTDRDGYVDNIDIVFEPKKTDIYFQANLATRADSGGRFWADYYEIKYNGFTGTSAISRYTSGLDSSGFTYNYGQIIKTAKIESNNKPYLLFKTQIPLFVYFDRLATNSVNSGYYQQLYGTDANTPKPLDVERFVNVSASAYVYSLNTKTNVIKSIKYADLMPDDKVFILGQSFILRVTEE